MAQANQWPSATVGSYSETVNAQGELQLSGVYKGTQVSQTVPCQSPCILFIDPVNRNFYAVDNIHEADPSWEFVKLIKAIQ